MKPVLYKRRSALVHGESAESVEEELNRLVRLLESEGGVVERRTAAEQLNEGVNAGTWIATIDYARRTKVLA